MKSSRLTDREITVNQMVLSPELLMILIKNQNNVTSIALTKQETWELIREMQKILGDM